MYFRKKVSGGRIYLQIAESQRIAGQVRQRVVATLAGWTRSRRAANWSGWCARGRASRRARW